MSAAWTEDEIRAATPFPKPQGARAAEWEREAGRCFAHVNVTPPERKLLQHIAEYADEVVVARSIHHDNWAATWLLVPMPAHLLALLHNFEAQVLIPNRP